MKRRFKILSGGFGVWSALVIFLLFAQTAFSQCGNYFKTNYRAVNKIYNVNNRKFGLDDWTGDGRSDFWNLEPNGSTSRIIIFPSRPSGYWDWENPIFLATTLPAGANGIFLAKDFNGDGSTDLSAEIFGVVTIHRNNGSGTLVAQTPFTYPPEFIENLGFHDLNGDGLLDWINIARIPQEISLGYHLGQANGAFGTRVSITTGQSLATASKAIGDFNGDSRTDIAYSTNFTGGHAYRLVKNLDGVNFEVGSPAVYGPLFGTRFQTVKDFNNDGRMDILATAYDTSSNPSVRKLFVLYGQSSDSFATTEYPVANSSESTFRLVATELTGDNQPDIIEGNQNFYSVYKNNGGGNFTRTDYPRSLVNGRIEDFSGDGKADLYYDDTAYPTVTLFNEQVVVIKENVCEPVGETKRANFGVDGVGDLVIWNPTTGNWRSFSPDLGFFGHNGTTTSFNWGGTGDVPAPGDYDADGITDHTIYRNSTGEWWIRFSSNGGWSVFRFGLPGDIAVPADYDGGGKTDIAGWRPSDGIWYIWYSETQSFGAAQFGMNGDKPVPHDYDGDGKTDIAVFRPPTATWYFLRSSDLGYSAVHWGLPTDIPVPADFDADGKADIAVYRDGMWYILRSMNLSFNPIFWGSASDLPIPLYQNGEFAQLVFYRPVNGTWYNLIRPPGNSRTIGFGQVSYSPVYFGLPNN